MNISLLLKLFSGFKGCFFPNKTAHKTTTLEELLNDEKIPLHERKLLDATLEEFYRKNNIKPGDKFEVKIVD